MTQPSCRVCSGMLHEDRATCNQCGAEFHLALRIDRPARDCGDAWIDDELQALVFGCNLCLGRVEAPTRPRRAFRAGIRASQVARGRRRPRIDR